MQSYLGFPTSFGVRKILYNFDNKLSTKAWYVRSLKQCISLDSCAANSIFLSHTDESSKDETRVCGCRTKIRNLGSFSAQKIDMAKNWHLQKKIKKFGFTFWFIRLCKFSIASKSWTRWTKKSEGVDFPKSTILKFRYSQKVKKNSHLPLFIWHYLKASSYRLIIMRSSETFFHITQNLTWYSAIVHKFTRIYPVCSTIAQSISKIITCISGRWDKFLWPSQNIWTLTSSSVIVTVIFFVLILYSYFVFFTFM